MADPFDNRPLVRALAACDLATVKRLLSQGESPWDVQGRKVAPAHVAAAAGATAALELFLANPAKIDVRDADQGWTPLVYAVAWNRVEAVRYLITTGADANAMTSHGYSVLHIALDQPDGRTAEIVKILLESGAKVDAAAPNGQTVLMSAVFIKDPDAVEYLLEWGAGPNQQDGIGATALYYAAFDGNPRIVDALLRHGADPSIRGNDGRLAETVAAENEHPEIAELLARSRGRQ